MPTPEVNLADVETTMAKCEMSSDDWDALSLKAKLLLQEATKLAASGRGVANLYVVLGRDYDGDMRNSMILARNFSHALELYREWQGLNEDFDAESDPYEDWYERPIAYAISGEIRSHAGRYGGVDWNSVNGACYNGELVGPHANG